MWKLLTTLVFVQSVLALPSSVEEVMASVAQMERLYEAALAKNRELEARVATCDGDRQQADNTVAFTASASQALNIANGNKLVFDSQLLNQGGGYSTSSGEFTAPRAGWYLMSVSVMSDNNNNCFFGLVQSGSWLQQSMADEAANYASATITQVTFLNQNEKVWVQAYESRGCRTSVVYGRPHFAGFLIAELAA